MGPIPSAHLHQLSDWCTRDRASPATPAAQPPAPPQRNTPERKQSCLLRKTFPNFVTLPKEETCSLWAIRDLNRPRPPPSRRARRFSALFMRNVFHSRVFYLYEVGGRFFFGKHGGFYELLTCPSPPFLRATVASVRDGDGRGCRAQRQRWAPLDNEIEDGGVRAILSLSLASSAGRLKLQGALEELVQQSKDAEEKWAVLTWSVWLTWSPFRSRDFHREVMDVVQDPAVEEAAKSLVELPNRFDWFWSRVIDC